ncbi:LAME_0G18360g1_1 [Lachancea meyersii CBS 8951]|uniref:LAME_0G18360g1_1 n=1 Tax=Lachancea meyersii CBS 8951 TaxID=1266667 RepID=A0A1G4KBR3_9SACH|nr:LAME_0G18360g1_1 [Lachancea meyersii CBS 8951]
MEPQRIITMHMVGVLVLCKGCWREKRCCLCHILRLCRRSTNVTQGTQGCVLRITSLQFRSAAPETITKLPESMIVIIHLKSSERNAVVEATDVSGSSTASLSSSRTTHNTHQTHIASRACICNCLCFCLPGGFPIHLLSNDSNWSSSRISKNTNT